MDRKTYGVLAVADRVKRPECADEGDLLVIPPGNPIRSMEVRSIARLGLSCGEMCRSDNTVKAVARLFHGGVADAPLVLRVSEAQKSSAPSGRRAQMLALIGNGREAGEEPQATIRRCKLQLVYNGTDIPRYVDGAMASDLMIRRVGEVMERLQQSNVSPYSGPLADVATVLAWSAFSRVDGVVDGTKPSVANVPVTSRNGSGALAWNTGGNLDPRGRTAVAASLAGWCPASTPGVVAVTGRFLAEAGRRGCAVVRCPQASAYATRARLRAHAERCAEAWRCRARALDVMRRFALKDLAVAKARAANFDRIAREVSDGRADHAFLQCMSGWDK